MLKSAGIRTQSGIIAESTSEGILLRPAVTLTVEIYMSEQAAEFDAAESDTARAFELGKGPETPAWIPPADGALKPAALRGERRRQPNQHRNLGGDRRQDGEDRCRRTAGGAGQTGRIFPKLESGGF
jgi:hypothetical protein